MVAYISLLNDIHGSGSTISVPGFDCHSGLFQCVSAFIRRLPQGVFVFFLLPCVSDCWDRTRTLLLMKSEDGSVLEDDL